MAEGQLPEPVRIVLRHIAEEGGSTTVGSLSKHEDVHDVLGRGFYVEDLVYDLAHAGYIDYDPLTGEVRAL